MTVLEMLEDIKSKIENAFAIKKITAEFPITLDRLPDADKIRQCCVYCDSWNVEGKTKIYRVMVMFRYAIEQISNETTPFYESHAQSEIEPIFDMLDLSSMVGVGMNRVEPVTTELEIDPITGIPTGRILIHSIYGLSTKYVC